MIARLVNNVYMIKGDFNVYLVINGEDTAIIDSSSGSDSNIILEGLQEIMTRYDVKAKYLFLTSHQEEVSGGASYISSALNIPYVIASEEDAVLIRKGLGKRSNYTPANVNFLIRDKKAKIDNYEIIKTNVPSKGSISIMFDKILFIGINKVSGIINKINYICDITECRRVEENWFSKSFVTHVEDLQRQNTVE